MTGIMVMDVVVCFLPTTKAGRVAYFGQAALAIDPGQRRTVPATPLSGVFPQNHALALVISKRLQTKQGHLPLLNGLLVANTVFSATTLETGSNSDRSCVWFSRSLVF